MPLDIGDMVRLKVTFTDTALVAGDPTTVTLDYRDPEGTTVTKTYAAGDVIRSATGMYYYDAYVGLAGTWYYKYTGTGPLACVGESTFTVIMPDITDATVTLPAGYWDDSYWDDFVWS